MGIYPKFLLTDVILGKLVKKIQELPTKDIFSIGEVGMDFEVARFTITNQQRQLKIFVELAKQLKLLLQLHVRNGGIGSAPTEILSNLKLSSSNCRRVSPLLFEYK